MIHRILAITALIASTALNAEGAGPIPNPFASRPVKSDNSKKARMVSKLVQGARETEGSQLQKHRNLDGGQAEVDLTGYVLQFQKCQFVKTYDDELAEDADTSTVLVTKRFITFRLCPKGTCGQCDSGYGEYVVDMDTYLATVAEYHQQDLEESCEFCNQICEGDDDGLKNAGYVDCDVCYSYCAQRENAEENGYVASYEFAECVEVWRGDDDGNGGVYAGAMCGNSGSSIQIGAFKDEYCSKPIENDISMYLENGIKLDNTILDMVADKSACMSCIQKDYEVNNNGENYYPEANEACLEVYEMAGKCESRNGFNSYWANYDEYANQYLQEDLICDFIDSLSSGNYDQYGDVTSAKSRVKKGGKGSTAVQKMGLIFFVVGSIALGVYSAVLHAQLTRANRTTLSAQGGSLA